MKNLRVPKLFLEVEIQVLGRCHRLIESIYLVVTDITL